MQIDNIIEKIINGIHPNWSTIYKIRYVYIELGKVLSKNTDFFFSVDRKLTEDNMSFKEIKEAYEKEDNLSTSVICKSSSVILKMIYDRLGISSKLVKSLNNVIEYDDGIDSLDINHWFLAVSDGKNEYFCTLSSDLPFIQMGMETRHFGVNIPYKKMVDGVEIQVYEGEEIKHKVIDRDFLRKIDIDIEYITNQYHYSDNYMKTSDWHYNYDDASLYMLSDALNSNKMYIDLETESTYFYHDLTFFKNEKGEEIDLFNLDNIRLNNGDWNKWKKVLCEYVVGRISEIVGYKINSYPSFHDPSWNYDDWLLNVCKQIQRYLSGFLHTFSEDLYVKVPFKYSKWSRVLKKELDSTFFDKDYDNVLMILDKMNALVTFVNQGKFNRHFSLLLKSLGYHFIHSENLFEESLVDGKVSSKYIAHKFKKLFNVIFDCNNTIGSFSRMNYSEQVVIIKLIIERMFKELNRENSSLSEHNNNYSEVFNRIQLYAIKNKKNKEYSIIFHILDDGTYVDTYYYFNPKTNEFKLANIFDIYSEYIIVSNRFKSRIEEMEDIEVVDEKKIKF